MSPRNRWARYQGAPRRQVEGGVEVAKPGKVTHAASLEIVEATVAETNPRILARGRTYARHGQVIDVQCEDGVFTARIQGSHARPYRVRLERTVISGSDRLDASCSCPYGCDYDWCKHAAALAYVAAFLVDNDEVVRRSWTGETVPAVSVEPLSAAEIIALHTPPPAIDPAQRVTLAQEVVPYPHR